MVVSGQKVMLVVVVVVVLGSNKWLGWWRGCCSWCMSWNTVGIITKFKGHVKHREMMVMVYKYSAGWLGLVVCGQGWRWVAWVDGE